MWRWTLLLQTLLLLLPLPMPEAFDNAATDRMALGA